MQKTEVINFRARPEHARKIREVAKQAGVSASTILRILIEQAEVKPIQAQVVLEACAENDRVANASV